MHAILRANGKPIYEKTHFARHQRRHRGLQILRTGAPAEKTGARSQRGHEPCGGGIRHPADLSGTQRPPRFERNPSGRGRQRHGAHQPHPRGRRFPDCARLSQHAGENRQRHRRQPLDQPRCRTQMPVGRRTRHECRNVAQPGQPTQHRATAFRRHHCLPARRRRAGLRRNGYRPDARSGGTGRPAARFVDGKKPVRQARVDYTGRDLRSHRPRARHHQPV